MKEVKKLKLTRDDADKVTGHVRRRTNQSAKDIHDGLEQTLHCAPCRVKDGEDDVEDVGEDGEHRLDEARDDALDASNDRRDGAGDGCHTLFFGGCVKVKCRWMDGKEQKTGSV